MRLTSIETSSFHARMPKELHHNLRRIGGRMEITMKKALTKQLSMFLCGALLISSISAAVYAANHDPAATSEKDDKAVETTNTSEITSQKLSASQKDETVYVLAHADGSVEKIIVSDWIQNSENSATIRDASTLTDIQNIKGDETYTLNENNMQIWDAQGNDIYYQGNTLQELPVALHVSYQLNGIDIAPEDLIGKSGKLRIRYTYENRQYETVEIDGQTEKIYVPFVMLTGAILDNDIFQNVTVENGKIINDGNRTVVIGIAFPGMQSNLALDPETLEIPESVEITADVTNFEMTNTITVALNEMFNAIDSADITSIDGLSDSISQLDDAMNQLLDGSSQLYDGLCTLLDKTDELVSGIHALTDGAKQLQDGSAEIKNGANALSEGANTLTNGLSALTENNTTLTDASSEVFKTLLSAADTQLAASGLDLPVLTIENYNDVLNGVIASLSENQILQQAEDKVTAAVNNNRDTIKAAVTDAVQKEVTSQVTAAVRTQVEIQVLATLDMTPESYQQAIAAGLIPEAKQQQITAVIDAKMQSTEILETINQNIEATMKSDEIQETIRQNTEAQVQKLIDDNMKSDSVQNQIDEALEAAKTGVEKITALQEQLNQYYAFYAGLIAYTDGVSSAQSGAQALAEGANTLYLGSCSLQDGATALYNGILTLNNGIPSLVDGVMQLRDGSMQLCDGLKEFRKEGVDRIIDAVDNQLGSLITRAKATIDVSKDYASFAGISDDMKGTVRFIYRTDALESNT